MVRGRERAKGGGEKDTEGERGAERGRERGRERESWGEKESLVERESWGMERERES